MRLMLVIGFCLALIGLASVSYSAQYLACDPQQNVVASEVEVDGTPMAGIALLSQDGQNLLLLQIDGLGNGPHTFRARLQDASGWWGEWSPAPFDASKPAGGNLKNCK